MKRLGYHSHVLLLILQHIDFFIADKGSYNRFLVLREEYWTVAATLDKVPTT